MTQITVPVTADHIANGKPGDCAECPVALAILDAIPDATNVQVYWAGGPGPGQGGASAAIWLPRGVLTGRLGKAADTFVVDFDWDQRVTPFTFTMTIPDGAS